MLCIEKNNYAIFKFLNSPLDRSSMDLRSPFPIGFLANSDDRIVTLSIHVGGLWMCIFLRKYNMCETESMGSR